MFLSTAWFVAGEADAGGPWHHRPIRRHGQGAAIFLSFAAAYGYGRGDGGLSVCLSVRLSASLSVCVKRERTVPVGFMIWATHTNIKPSSRSIRELPTPRTDQIDHLLII